MKTICIFKINDRYIVAHKIEDAISAYRKISILSINAVDMIRDDAILFEDADNTSDTRYTVEEIHEEAFNIEELERESIKRALAKNNNNKQATAEALGISLATLRRKIKEYQL